MWREAWPLYVACFLYIALSVLVIPLAGIQADEAIFSAPLYGNINQDLSVGFRRFFVPLMVMNYLGSLKTILYAPWLAVVPANVWTIRLPMVLAGVFTIFLFYRLTDKTVGRGAAIAGAFLLATDPLFILTNAFDWGPVALEHLLLVTGCYALVRFGHQNDSGGPFWHSPRAWLAAGFFFFGLALWNKAIFSWALTGLVSATALTLWKTVLKQLTVRHLATAAVAFLLGAAPLVYFNVRHGFATVRQNAHLAPQEIPGKWIQLESGLRGTSMFGYIPNEEWMEPAKSPSDRPYRVSEWLRNTVGGRLGSRFDYLLGGLLLLIPLWWRSRVAWFALVFSAVTWLMMAATRDAGGSGHHVVLLWPFPILFAAVVLGRLPRWIAVTVVLVAVGFNLMVNNQYFYQLKRNGTTVWFTDAIFPLSEAFPDGSDQTLYITDWGIHDPLNLLHQGRLRLGYATDFALREPNPQQVEVFGRMLSDPKGLFIGHVAKDEFFVGATQGLESFAAKAGKRRELLRTIPDSNGRPMFEISRVVPIEVAPDQRR